MRKTGPVVVEGGNWGWCGGGGGVVVGGKLPRKAIFSDCTRGFFFECSRGIFFPNVLFGIYAILPEM